MSPGGTELMLLLLLREGLFLLAELVGGFWLPERHLLAMETSDSLKQGIGRAGMTIGGKFA